MTFALIKDATVDCLGGYEAVTATGLIPPEASQGR